MSSRWMMTAAAACTSLLLAACVPGLSDDAGLYFGRNDGSEAISERQTVEVYIRDTAPRYAGIIEDVAREAGGVRGVNGDSRYRDCATRDEPEVNIAWADLYVALIDYDDLRRIVWEGAQRNGFAYSATPDYSGKYNSRSVAVGDEGGTLVAFTHLEGKGFINISFHSGCMLPTHTYDLDTPYKQLPLPSVEEMFPNLRIVDAFDENSNLNPELSSQSGPQSGAQSGS